MVRMPWGKPPPEEVDRLIVIAESLAMGLGPGPEPDLAAERAVAAARKRVDGAGSREDRGRLLRALARVALNGALQPPAARNSDLLSDGAEQIIALAQELLAEPVPADAVRAEAVVRLAQAGQILAVLGQVERGRALVEEAWQAVADRPADDADARRARTAALTALVSRRLDDLFERASRREEITVDPALGRQAGEMVDLQRALAIEDGLDTSLYDLAEALGQFGRAAILLGRPDLAGWAWAEETSILMGFDGPSARSRFSEVTRRLGGLQQMAPDVQVVVPGPGAWRTRGSYQDHLE